MKLDPFYLVPLVIGLLAYPVGYGAVMLLNQGSLEGSVPGWFALLMLLIVVLPVVAVTVGGTVVVGTLAERPDLLRLALIAVGSAVISSALIVLVFDYLPSRARRNAWRADQDYLYAAKAEFERTSHIDSIRYEVEPGERLRVQVTITVGEAGHYHLVVSFIGRGGPDDHLYIKDDKTDHQLPAGETTLTSNYEADWQLSPDHPTWDMSISATLYRKVKREDRELQSISIYNSVSVPGLYVQKKGGS